MFDYSWRIWPKTKRGKMWGSIFTLFWIFFIFFPWGKLGVEPLAFGWLPNWLLVLMVVQVIYLTLWWVFMREKEKEL
ncbi:hypothetical protein [Candidatus Formimonas warabiya]|uniref:Uncharacterized protein n=1 Tax=Formimonas warabiya TaxID=1761012 RepID=A0A3G1KWC3_FORW1|nr:hypothetical protein [Candidatus Formimonas warabiya]ATW26752.1 hypothetical protein DCMF_20065 [Candidatus Formimonas warabiya]